MWKDLSAEWHIVFEEVWLAFRNGSTPIGAAIFDENGSLLVRDRNRSAEPGTVNKRISHAEANALRRLDNTACNVRNAVLYTSMEPCPMCMGTAVMSNIRHLRYASCDPYCGCVHLKDDEPYIRSKGLDYTNEGGEPEFVQLVIQSYYELRSIDNGSSDKVFARFAGFLPSAAETARQLYAEKRLDRLAASGAGFPDVYDEIAGLMKKG